MSEQSFMERFGPRLVANGYPILPIMHGTKKPGRWRSGAWSDYPDWTRHADSTLVTQAINGAPCELEFSYTLVSGESLTVTVHAVYLPRPRIEIGGPQGIQASFDWQAARDATLGRMCTVTLINDVENY